ncbi:hypothetical protein LIER_40905 [Lithospermum erythrorhizon]|uniref:Uncharacterized protein n=1 Tax=Lithospermum erythrorhizon TaxID=34254 RepID=A0AAV3R503_LITER
MLIREIGKRRCRKMMNQVNHTHVSPTLGLEGLFRQSNRSFGPFKVQFFLSTGPVRNLKLLANEPKNESVSLSIGRISRVERADAQAALFDYLHCTRGFTFSDAEHISKNSPQFLQNLLSKVDYEHDVSRALSKFFRYHPINEFEPFFESLGLPHSEVLPVLPRDLMFINDDQVLLENFHALCDYGIPRIKIGRLYLEASEIFSYSFGVLPGKLRAYEESGLSRPTVIQLVTSYPSLLVGDVNKDLVGVLNRLRELQLGNDWIGGYVTTKGTCSWRRVLDTMHFLDEAGFDDRGLQLLITKNPALLLEGSGKQIYVLICRFLKFGLKMNEVYALFLENPDLLLPKCVKNLYKGLYFLFEIGMETDTIAKIVVRHIKLLSLHPLKGPKTVLRDFKGDKGRLRQVIREEPLKLFTLASKSKIKNIEITASQDPGKVLEKTAFLLRLGYLENSDEMTKALKKFRGRGDQLQERFNCLVEAGLDCNVVSSMIKKAPTVLNQSKDVLEEKLNYLQNMGYPVASIENFPSYLCYDISRISLRFSMYEWLRNVGAAKPMLSVSTLLACSDARFHKYFVDIHAEGPAIWESLRKSLQSS